MKGKSGNKTRRFRQNGLWSTAIKGPLRKNQDTRSQHAPNMEKYLFVFLVHAVVQVGPQPVYEFGPVISQTQFKVAAIHVARRHVE